jgi:hypothetical protein
MGLILVIYPEGSAETFLRIIGIVIALGAIGELVETAYVMGTIKEDITPTVASDAKELPFEEK